MKKLIILLPLLALISCSKTLKQRQAEYVECEEKAAEKLMEKYAKLSSEEEKQQQFLLDMCKFYEISSEEECALAITQVLMVDKLNEVINTYVVESTVKPNCGEYPLED